LRSESFKSHGDGWRFTPAEHWKHGSRRLSCIGQISARGQARQGCHIRLLGNSIPKVSMYPR
jgi:putative transposase